MIVGALTWALLILAPRLVRPRVVLFAPREARLALRARENRAIVLQLGAILVILLLALLAR